MTEPICMCAMSRDNCGPEGCRCTTTIMDCAVHRDTDAAKAEAAIVRQYDESASAE